MRCQIRSTGYCVLLAVALLTPNLSATTLLPMSVAQLSDQAELIFVGTAVHSESVPTADASYAYTFVTFEVERIFKGAVDKAQLVLRFDGGDLDAEQALDVLGMPQFFLGETYLLFVAGNERAASPVLGWSQGQIGLQRDERSGEDVLFDRSGASVLGIEGDHWQLAERIPDDQLLVEVVAEDGVEIVGGPVAGLEQARQKDSPLPPAAVQVLAELQSFLDARAQSKSFRAGALVLDASPLNVPASREFEVYRTEEGR